MVENFVREASVLGHVSEILSTLRYCRANEIGDLSRLNELGRTTLLPESAWGLLGSGSRRRVREAVGAADIVHVHTLWAPLTALACYECRRQRRPYVIMPHGMLDPYSLDVRRWRKRFYLWAIEERNIRGAQRAIFTTDEERHLAMLSTDCLPVSEIVSLGADAPDNSDTLRRVFADAFPLSIGRRQLLFLGRLEQKKGIDRIIDVLPRVVRRFPDVLLTVVGEGPGEWERQLQRAVESRGMKGSVLFTGRLQGDLKWGAYASAELFLLPSRQENFAITVAEAMQMGVPVVVTRRVNTWPYVLAAQAGFVLEEDRLESDLEGAILWSLTNYDQARRMGRRGFEFARNNLTWRNGFIELCKSYEEVIHAWKMAR